MIKIDKTAKISKYVDIEDSKQGTKIIVGAECVIDSFVKIKPSGGSGDILIGNKCYINSGCVLYSGNGITIDDNVSIAANCTFAPVNHEYLDKNKLIQDQGFSENMGGIIIEKDVWIGAGSILLDGTILKEGCVIGAGSIVNGEVEAYTINIGSPLVRRINIRR